MTTLADIEWEPCVLEPTRDRKLERFVRKALGFVPPMATYFFPCPWIVRSMVAFDASQLSLAQIDIELARVIDLVVSQDNSCRYCFAASRALLKLIGLGESRIQQLEQRLFNTYGDAKETRALEFVRRVSRANPLPAHAEVQQLLSAGYTPKAVRELAFVAATCVFYNRLSTLPALPTARIESLASGRALELWGPLLARLLKPARPERAGAVGPEALAGPYAYLVRAFEGLPLAAALGGVLREAFRSPDLPRRAKALVFAVVGRALGCPFSEREATGVLAAEGLQPPEVERILAHLASPALDRLEAAIVPFARETIWYRPAVIQRRTRELRAALTNEQFLELIAVVSLANAVCRMSVVLALP